MRWLRDWLGWAAAWTLVAQAPMWVWVGLDVLEERREPTLDAAAVAGWMDPVALVPAVVVPLAALLALVPRTRRVGLALGGAALLLAAWAWSGLSEGDVGSWYVALSAAAGVVGLAAAAVGPGSGGPCGDELFPRAASGSLGSSWRRPASTSPGPACRGAAHWSGRPQRWIYGVGAAPVGALMVVPG